MGRRVPDDLWKIQRGIWEVEPTYSHNDVARALGVSRQAVQQRANREDDPWKRLNDPVDLAKRAQAMADTTVVKPVEDPGPMPVAVIPPPKPGDEPSTFDKAEPISAIGDPVEARARILARHRSEWDGSRSFIYKAINAGKNAQDIPTAKAAFEMAKLGKITSEALKIVQDGERKAWGLETEVPDPVIVTRF